MIPRVPNGAVAPYPCRTLRSPCFRVIGEPPARWGREKRFQPQRVPPRLVNFRVIQPPDSRSAIHLRKFRSVMPHLRARKVMLALKRYCPMVQRAIMTIARVAGFDLTQRLKPWGMVVLSVWAGSPVRREIQRGFCPSGVGSFSSEKLGWRGFTTEDPP